MRRAFAVAVAVVVGVVLAAVGTVALAARDSGGTYSRPAGNPVTTGTPITATWANTLTADLATEITASLDRTGRGPMLSALKLYSGGNATTPELVWNDDTNSGFYLIGADNVGLSLGGTKKVDFATTGTTFVDPVTASSDVTISGDLTSGDIVAPSLKYGAGAMVVGTTANFDVGFIASGVTGFGVIASGTNYNGDRRLTNVADPTGAQDAATKAYVDAMPGNDTTYSCGSGWTCSAVRIRKASNALVYFSASVAYPSGGGSTPALTLNAGYRPGVIIAPARALLGGTDCALEINTLGQVGPSAGFCAAGSTYRVTAVFLAEN